MLFSGFFLVFKRPLSVRIGHSETGIISHMVDNDSTFTSLVSHTPHGLLDIQCQRFGRAEKYGTLAVRNIKALADKVNVA
jgi:hypothetical protein